MSDQMNGLATSNAELRAENAALAQQLGQLMAQQRDLVAENQLLRNENLTLKQALVRPRMSLAALHSGCGVSSVHSLHDFAGVKQADTQICYAYIARWVAVLIVHVGHHAGGLSFGC